MTPRDEKDFPRAAWGRFPLSELLVVLAIICGVAGLVTLGSDRSGWLIAACFTFGCLAGFEIALREHLARRKSRSGLLAGSVAMLVTAGLLVANAPAALLLPAMALTFAVAWLAFENAYTRSR